MGKLDGKIALITGGNSGIGLATAKRFVGEGAYVFITGRRDAELAAAVAAIGKNIKALSARPKNSPGQKSRTRLFRSKSLHPLVGSKGLPNNSVYAATKAVARSFARTWTTDLKPRRIRVNAISPGSIDTPGLNGLLASAPAGEQRRKIIETVTPLGRFGAADEIAAAAVFLASDNASYITGIELFVDGGFAQV
jgi:NAD(P)-dependent dehydrogenase (short-subunit alcohol dehydrogenase family)